MRVPTKEFILLVLLVVWTQGLYDLNQDGGSQFLFSL